jgi:hypothetical protein
MSDLWTYRETSVVDADTDLMGFDVEALDGGIGNVDEASNDVGAGYIVVNTGPWIFGKKVMLPAGVIDRVDINAERVYVQRTKDEIKNAPEFDEGAYRDSAYRERLGSYYGPGGAGYYEGSRESTATGSYGRDHDL